MSNKEYQGAIELEAIDVSAADHVFDADKLPRAIWVGTAGALEIVDQAGNTVVIPSASGQMNIQPTQILNANTAASGIVAFY